MSDRPALKIVLKTDDFFFIPLKKMTVECEPGTGRTYFIYQDHIVGVAVPATEEGSQP